MGQCQSDNNSLADGITSLPPTLSLPHPSSRSLESYSPPKLLTPRQRKSIVQQEVITTLSPPQSPAMAVTRSKEKIKEAEVDQIRSIGMTIEVSSNIDVVDIKPKMTNQLRATKSDNVSTSPPIPFHKQALATPRLNIATEAAVLPQMSKDDISSNRSDAKKLEARYEGILRMLFVCYIAAVAFFFSIMCRSLFHQHTNANAHGVATVAAIDTNTETKKGQLEFFQAIGHFNLQEDLMPLLPLNAMKEMLSDNNKEYILDMIEQELSEIIHDQVLI